MLKTFFYRQKGYFSVNLWNIWKKISRGKNISKIFFYNEFNLIPFKDIKSKCNERQLLWLFACFSPELRFWRFRRRGSFGTEREIYHRFASKRWDCIHASSDRTPRWKFEILASCRLLDSGEQIGRHWISIFTLSATLFSLYVVVAFCTFLRIII